MIPNYSQAEIAMFTKLGFERELKTNLFTPRQVYLFAITKAFLEEQTGSAVESLRRTYKAMDDGFPRICREFDNLIKLED